MFMNEDHLIELMTLLAPYLAGVQAVKVGLTYFKVLRESRIGELFILILDILALEIFRDDGKASNLGMDPKRAKDRKRLRDDVED
jgi:hypothetical protein